MITIRQASSMVGEKVRVKATFITKDYGIRCRGWADGNNRVWPNEVGVMCEDVISGLDWSQRILFAEFSGGRRVDVAEMVDEAGYAVATDGKWVACHGDYANLLTKHKTKAKS